MKNKWNLIALFVATAGLLSCQVCDEIMSLDVNAGRGNEKVFNAVRSAGTSPALFLQAPTGIRKHLKNR
jgi:hypothetical protein